MGVFEHPDFDDHELVLFCSDSAAGLRAIIAIHDTTLGPALGGCRMWPYASDDEALRDVLRLSRGMSYKSAISNLPLGGGKSVIIGDPRADKSDGLLRAFGRCIDALGGRYIAAEDSGTTVDDLKTIGAQTAHVAGVADKPAGDGGSRSGDPSPATAYGVFAGVRAAVAKRLGRDDLAGVKVAIQGVGSVGFRLAQHLKDAGAQLWVCDVHAPQVDRAVRELGATAVAEQDIFELDVDVFAPCALGAVIDDRTVRQLRASVVAGAANNQLAEPRHAEMLRERGILYAPDYVINAGGIIDVSLERLEFDREQLLEQLDRIYDTLMQIFERAEVDDLPPSVVADRVAEERLSAK